MSPMLKQPGWSETNTWVSPMSSSVSDAAGADFDHEYMKEMVSDHKKDVKEFQSAAKSAADPEIKNFASSTLPTLQQHLDMAQQAEAATKNESSTKTSSAR